MSNKNDQKEQRKKENKEIFFTENYIKNYIKSNKSVFKFEKFGLLNKDWFVEFLSFIHGNKQNEKQIFSSDKFVPTLEDKYYKFNNNVYLFLVPDNFVLVSLKFIELLLQYYDEEYKKKLNELIYEVIIGGKCIIIKERKLENIHYISLYNEENKEFNYNHYIDYILIDNDKQFIIDEIKLILKHTISLYLQSKKIELNSQIISKSLVDNDKKGSAQIILNQYLKNFNTLKILEIENIIKPISSKPNFSEIKSILMCLYQFKNFTEELIKYKNDNYKLTNIIIDVFNNFNNIDKFESKLQCHIEKLDFIEIIPEIFEKIDLELQENKNKVLAQIEQSTEDEARKIFEEGHKNSSIIERFFYIRNLTKKTCLHNSKISYKYDNLKFLSVNLDKKVQNISLFEILTNVSMSNKMEHCEFCQSKKMHKKETKITEFPKILAVILEGEIGKFPLEKNYNIIDKKNNKIIYMLNCFIELETNNVYFKKGSLWFKNCNNKEEQVKNITIKPIILFYKNISNKNNININNNSNNILPNNNMFNINNLNNNMVMNGINMNKGMDNKYNNINSLSFNKNFNIKDAQHNININGMNMNYSAKNNININGMIINNNMQNNMNINGMNMNNNAQNNMNSLFKKNNMINLNTNNNMNINNSNNIMNNNVNNNINFLNSNYNMNNVNYMNENNFNIQMNNNINKSFNNIKSNNNNLNNNIISQNINSGNNQKNQFVEKPVFLTFTFKKYNKQIFIDVDDNDIFQNVIIELEEKYDWLKSINGRKYFLNNREIKKNEFSKTVKNLGIIDNSNIVIVVS